MFLGTGDDMKKYLFISLSLIAGLFLSAKAASDEKIVSLIDQKKDKIKIENVIEAYKDFIGSIKSDYISRFIKEWLPEKEKLKEMYIFMTFMQKSPSKKAKELYNKGLINEVLKEVGLSRADLEREFEKEWNPKATAELNFSSQLGFGRHTNDPNLVSDLKKGYNKEIKEQKIQLSPAAFFVKMTIGPAKHPTPLGAVDKKQYKEAFKQRLIKEFNLK